MKNSTRRGFLAMAGAGAVAGAAVVAAPGAMAADDESLPAGAQGRMAAYIKDVQKGELLVMVDDHEVVLTDPKLVARLARAFDRAARA